MTDYLHHVPGRLRMRSRILTRHSEARVRLLQDLQVVLGVSSVRLNSKAGSVTILYEVEKTSVDQILMLLNRNGTPASSTVAKPATSSCRAITGMLGKMALNILVSRGVSYSLSSLLGARI